MPSDPASEPYYINPTSHTPGTARLVDKIEQSSVIPIDHVPENLERATMRLEFPPSYVVVGIYRLISDKSLRVPIWKKCEHGVVRGAVAGLGWVSLFLNEILRESE